MAFTPSPQQAAVIDWVRDGSGSAFVEAVAGAGKTTLLIEALAETTGSVVFTAYNKKIAQEIEARVADRANPDSDNYDPRFAGFGNRLRIGTFHSFGFSSWRRVAPGVKLDQRAKETRTEQHLQLPKTLTAFVPKLVSLAKQRALGLFGSIDDESLWYDIIDHFDLAHDIEDAVEIPRGVELAIKALRFHQQIANEVIDFDDMIYMPVVTGSKMWQNDWVLVDEAQDTNPARRALVRKMLQNNGRAIFVGDRAQAIYGFTGADADAIDQIVHDFRCVQMPLTVTFRCPKAVVALARTVVSHIEAADVAPEGVVSAAGPDDWKKMVADKMLRADDAILCRNTKPLVSTAYSLIRAGVACHVEGKDIGVGLLKLANRYAARSLDELREKLELYMDREVAKLVSKGKETQAEALEDRIQTLFVIMDECQSLDQLRQKIADMFLDADSERRPTLTLSTVHKAKGREWEHVYILNRDALMPSRWARQAWQLEQENNLIYVAYTRAKHELTLLSLDMEERKPL